MPDPRIRGLTGIFKDTKHIPAQAEAMLDSQVNPFRACNPSANHDSNVFRAGQLTDFVTQWQHMQAPTPMIQIIQNFRIPFLARPPLQTVSWRLFQNEDYQTLDPIFWIKKLIALSQSRRSICLQSNLFLTVCGTPKAASRTNIAGWVKKILLQAGIKASPGSVRPAVASKNWVQN
ncbi:putative reverse transcriptase-7 [Operophtera brumata]|uniref:Putative reverse transcriptase-7 n=1 Tax=Operophtera brumata TaxID=104452 RepID=A0A0L7L1X6_OPEBR|nr:putative reverse transcriptase-7 [Operophtera brumata]